VSKFKVGDIIEFNIAHIKPNTNRKVIVFRINVNSYYTFYDIFPKVMVLSGGIYDECNSFPETCGLEEHAIKIGEVNGKLLKILYE
jgi:hypothetical protein